MRSPLPDRPILSGLIALKVMLGGLLLTGALAPDVGGFAGKGMAFRLPFFLAPSLIVPMLWWRGRRWSTGLDVAFTVPFLLDTIANAFGWFDSLAHTDDVLHCLNWMVLIGGIAWHLFVRRDDERRLLWATCAGLSALCSVGWEIAEWAVQEAGTVGLHLTYSDTIGDLALSTGGGIAGATMSWWWTRHRPVGVAAKARPSY
jgi:hypothetical protein